jgi:hypothetical protein
MTGKTEITLPLLKLGRLPLDPALRARQPGSAASGLVVTATVPVPDAPTERQYAWEVAWADAVRQAGQLGADTDTAEALAVGAALDEITATAIDAVADLVAERAAEPTPAAVRGIAAVADQLAEQQVAVLLLAADVAAAALPGVSYRIGSRPTEFLVDEDEGTEVPLADGLVWAALNQDAIIVQLPDRTGPLAGEPAAALLRRGAVP